MLNALQASPRGAGAQVKVRDYGRVALITGSYKSAQAGERNDLYALDVWVKEADGWKALIHHNNVLARPDAPAAHAAAAPRPATRRRRAATTRWRSCPTSRNRRPSATSSRRSRRWSGRSRATIPDEWTKHVADEFVVTRTRQHPTDKAARMAFMATQRAINAETFVAEVTALKFWVLGDAAIMRADHAMPGNRRPPYRATRLWVKRDGRWQMALSQQTTIQP